MKKLVLGSLLLATLVSQTTGCVITSSDDEDFATINADWSFHSVNPSGQLSPGGNCPTGFNTVALHTQEVDASLRPIGQEVVDLFDCVNLRNFSDPLPPGVYETFLAVTSDGGATVYADTLPAIVDVTTSDKTYSAQIIDNGGYFKVAWDLRKQNTNAPLSCADNPDLDGVEITSTLVGSTAFVNDQFDCELGFDFSAAVMEGTYTVVVNAFKDGNPDQQVGKEVTLTNKVMRDRNQVTDLGAVTLLVP